MTTAGGYHVLVQLPRLEEMNHTTGKTFGIGSKSRLGVLRHFDVWWSGRGQICRLPHSGGQHPTDTSQK